MQKKVFPLHDETKTELLGAVLSGICRPDTTIYLTGDLGAGKTTFTQGLAAALGVPGRVTSPTFCIVQEHQSKDVLLVHMDLYRLRGEEDVEAIGWEDYLARGAILVIEWPDRAGGLVPQDARHLVFRHLGEEKRIVTIRQSCTTM